MHWTFHAFAVTEMTWEALRAAHEPCGDVWKTVVSVRHVFRSCCDISIGQFLLCVQTGHFSFETFATSPGYYLEPFLQYFLQVVP